MMIILQHRLLSLLQIIVILSLPYANGSTHLTVDWQIQNGDIHNGDICTCSAQGCTTLGCAISYAARATSDPTMLYIGVQPGTYTTTDYDNDNDGFQVVNRNTVLYGVSGDPNDVIVDVTTQPSRFSTLLTVGAASNPGMLTNTSVIAMTFVGAWDTAIYVTYQSTVVLTNIVVRHSRIEPGLYVDRQSTVTMSGSTFTDNGDLVSESVVSVIEGSNVYVSDCEFTDNQAVRVFFLRTNEESPSTTPLHMNFTNVNIMRNGLMGIEINAQKRKLYVHMVNVTMSHNGLSNNADAMRISSTLIPPSITMVHCEVTNNNIAFAAVNVIANVHVDLFMDNCLVSRNSGGTGVFKQGYGTFLIQHSEVSWNDNEVSVTFGLNDGGGALQVAGNATINDVLITTNLAAQGGGLYVGTQAANVEVVDSMIVSNTASGDGSAVYANCKGQLPCNVVIRNTIFDYNKIVPQALDNVVHDASMISATDGASVSLDNCSAPCSNEPNNLVCVGNSAIHENSVNVCGQSATSCRSQTVVVAAVLISIMVMIACIILSSVWYKRWTRKKAEVDDPKRDSAGYGSVEPWDVYSPPVQTPKPARPMRGRSSGRSIQRASLPLTKPPLSSASSSYQSNR